MRINLSDCKDVYQIKDAILKNDYKDCQIVLNEKLYGFLTGGNGRLYVEFNQLCKNRRIEIMKKYV